MKTNDRCFISNDILAERNLFFDVIIFKFNDKMANSVIIVEEPSIHIKQLSETAGQVNVDPSIPPRRYFRSGLEIVRMANVYMEEGSLESAFILYTKFIILFVEKLPGHKDYKTICSADRANIKKQLKEVFVKAEELKKRLKQKYTEDYEKFLEHQRFEAEQERLKNLELNKITSSKRQNGDIKNNFNINDMKFPIETDLPNSVIPTWPSLDKEDRSAYLPSAPSAQDISPDDNLKNGSLPVVPTFDRGNKPSSLLSASQHLGLRQVVVPVFLMSKFLVLAEENTRKNVETCGILCGIIAQNSFTITHLVIPKQHGSSDSCITENEEDIFEYQDKHNLVTLGWIHTHPSQTSFLSSVDLHTHCSYQLMMPEAIAIVCAPNKNETGIYSLTPEYGLDYIAKCHETGFHPHPSHPPLYKESSHAKLDSSVHITVSDLR